LKIQLGAIGAISGAIGAVGAILKLIVDKAVK
jgi:hypothetical protein